MSVHFDVARARQLLESKSDQELMEMWRRHDLDEWSSEALDIVRQILQERALTVPEVSPSESDKAVAWTPRAETRIDVAYRWVAAVVCALGTAVYSVGLATQAPRIVRDPMEDGILPGLLYCLSTGLGVLRSFRPSLPRLFHQVSALANALMAVFVIMLWVFLFQGSFRSGEYLPLVATVLYWVMLRATRIEDHFRPWWWMAVLTGAATVGLFYAQHLALAPAPLSTLNRRADLLGGVTTAVVAVWVGLLVVGFWRARERSAPAHSLR